MRREGRFRRASTLFCAVLSVAGLGWGPDGHKIVAEIAGHYLKPEAQAAVAALLDGKSMPQVANWADYVRGEADYEWSGPLHYADVPDDAEEFILNRDCPERGCVCRAILEFSAVLQNGSASTDEKKEALKFVIHFVGDNHQPLHAGYEEDQGGNRIKVEFFSQSNVKLHAVWDSKLIRHRSTAWKEYANTIRHTLTTQKVKKWQAVADPVDWTNESFHLAVSNAYKIPNNRKLGQAYFDRNIPVIERRLAMGGVRLAGLLNAIYVPGGEPTGGPFVGSRRSKVYHLPNCGVVERIRDYNLVTYDSKPYGKRLHKGCPW